MKKKKKPVQINIKALQKLIKSVSHFSESQKVKVRNISAATLAVILVVGIFASIPQVRNYFSSQPGEAFGIINPGVNPGTGIPIPYDKAPWGTGPSDDLPNPVFKISIDPPRKSVFAGLDTRFEIKIDTNMGFGVANDGIIELFSPELDEAVNSNRITDYRFKSEYPWPSDPIFCGPDSHFTVFLYIDTFINTDLGNAYSYIPFTVIGTSNQTASYEQTGGVGEYIVTSNTGSAVTIIKNTDWKPFGNISTVGQDSQEGQMYGDKIVFRQFSFMTLGDIYMKDMSTGIITPICTNAADQWSPIIYENYIAWADDRNGNPDIYLYDLSNPLAGEKNITASSSLSDWRAAVYGQYIVYVHGSYSEPENSLNIYDIESQTTTVLEYAHTPGPPDIYENKIIWTEGSDFPYALVHLYNISTGEETILTTHTAGSQTDAQIHKNLVVWVERILSGSPTSLTTKVHLYNIDNHTDKVIADYKDTGGIISAQTNVSDDWVIWLGDETNETPSELDVFFHKISDPIGRNYKITDDNDGNQTDQIGLSVFKNKAIYSDLVTSTVKIFELMN